MKSSGRWPRDSSACDVSGIKPVIVWPRITLLTITKSQHWDLGAGGGHANFVATCTNTKPCQVVCNRAWLILEIKLYHPVDRHSTVNGEGVSASPKPLPMEGIVSITVTVPSTKTSRRSDIAPNIMIASGSKRWLLVWLVSNGFRYPSYTDSPHYSAFQFNIEVREQIQGLKRMQDLR